MSALTEVELIARHHIHERTHPEPRLPRRGRRTRLAGTLRRVADRLDG